MTTYDQVRSGRLVILTIVGLPLTMILAATWLWWFVVKGDLDLVGMLGTANSGELLQPPRQLLDHPVMQGGEPYVFAGEEALWSLLVPVPDSGCDRRCEETLYVTRQIHVAIGRDFNRLRRLVVSTAPPSSIPWLATKLSSGNALPEDFPAYLAQEQQGLEALQLPSPAWDALFAEWQAEPSSWYLVDPAGWIMMSYDSDVHYKDVISDLKFLLKNSGG